MAFLKCFSALFVIFIGGFVYNADISKAETIKVVGVLEPPYLMTTTTNDFYRGFIPDLLDIITERINVNYTLENVSRYGSLDNTGAWNGMMADLVNKKADVAALLTITYWRAQDVQFSHPVFSAGPSIVLKRPPKERMRITDNIDSLFKPFDFTVWLMTILAFFVTSTALYMISHFNPYEWRRMFKDREATLREAESFTCMNAFWFSISTMTLQDYVNSLFEPFEFTNWLMTILAFFVTSTALYMISHFNPYEWRRMFKDREATLREAESFTSMNAFWFSISIMTLQGYVRAPRSVGGRIVVTAWWFFIILLLLSYVASLTNLLRVGPKPLEAEGYSKIRGFSDLAKSNGIKVLVLPNGSTQAYFKTSEYVSEKTIAMKMDETLAAEPIQGVHDGIQKIRDRPFSDIVMVMESNTARFLTQQEPCDIYMVSDNIITSQQGFAFTPGFKYASEFNNALLMLKERGKLRELETKWFPSFCEDSVVDSHESGTYEFQKFYKLDLGAFFGAVLILGLGLILGGFTTVVEVCIYKWAETHVDDDETKVEPASNDRLMEDSAVMRGGATQV